MKRGIAYALAAAILFGASTPLAKLLVGEMASVVLAGLLYAGSGIGLATVVIFRAATAADARAIAVPSGREWLWLAGAIAFGGVMGPVLLMRALVIMPAAPASLLLNLEGVFTALLAWFLFHEHFDRRIASGMLAIVAGGALLAWQRGTDGATSMGALLIAGACACWALDNNFTRRVSGSDAAFIAALKGIVGAFVNLSAARALEYAWPAWPLVVVAAALGFVGYGASLTLFVLALRHLGSARTGAYFSVAPFFGALVALAIYPEPFSVQLIIAGVLMALGVWLHLTEHHEHRHVHVAQTHSHEHSHDEHHRHVHEPGWDGVEPHAHPHSHEPLAHAHEHYPDEHHRHGH